jgi:uncharacterized protein
MKKVLLFIVLTFTICWGGAFAFYQFGFTNESPAYAWFNPLYLFTPFLVAIFVQKVIYKEEISGPFLFNFKPSKWFAVAIATPLVLVLVAFLIAMLLGNIHFSMGMEAWFDIFLSNKSPQLIASIKAEILKQPAHPFFMVLINGLLSGITIHTFFAIGQEVAWRGFLLNALKDKGYFNASILIGLISGFWYAPFILMGELYPQHPWAGVFLYPFIGMFLSPIYTFITLKANSIIASALFHGTLNGVAILSFMMLKGGSDLMIGINGLAGLAAVLLVMALFMDYDRLTKAKIFRDE